MRLDFKKPVNGTFKLTSLVNGSTLDNSKYVIFRVNENALIATVHLPAPGEYCLEIFGAESKANVHSLNCIWKYFLVSKIVSSMAGLLSNHEDHTYGTKPELIALGLTPKFSGDPLMKTQNSEMLLQFLYTNPVNMTFKLTQIAGETTNLLSAEYVIWQVFEKEKLVYFQVYFIIL